MIQRSASKRLLELASKFKAVAVTGPRQSGKTTLVKTLFPGKSYCNLENPDVRMFAEDDPRGFLSQYPHGAVLDEVQRVPALFSYLQEILDNRDDPGQFILTGSNNFLLQENISQSLAGRIAYLHLLPFSVKELYTQNTLPNENVLICTGFYPPIHDRKINPSDWHANYVKTYIERDVRQIKNIYDLIPFDRFLRLLAGRVGQEVNFSSLSVEAGIDMKTAQSWLGILESSFIIFLVRPYYKNFNKTIVKRPKLYFYDTGLACSLLRIHDPGLLITHPLRGPLFECFVASEIMKSKMISGNEGPLFYWRDKTGHEIDIILEQSGSLIPIEIKAGMTVRKEFLKNLNYFNRIRGNTGGVVIFGGDQEQVFSDGTKVLSWKSLHDPSILIN